MNRKLRRHHILSAVMVTTLAAASGCTSANRHADTPASANVEPGHPIAQPTPTPAPQPTPRSRTAATSTS